MTRLQANLILLSVIEQYCRDYPEQRFQQVLCNLGLLAKEGEDRFYEESTETLHKLDIR